MSFNIHSNPNSYFAMMNIDWSIMHLTFACWPDDCEFWYDAFMGNHCSCLFEIVIQYILWAIFLHLLFLEMFELRLYALNVSGLLSVASLLHREIAGIFECKKIYTPFCCWSNVNMDWEIWIQRDTTRSGMCASVIFPQIT